MPSTTIGACRLDLILDAEINISGDSVFAYASRGEWTAHVPADANGEFVIPVRPLLIRGQEGNTLVDTGFGEIASLVDDSEPKGRTLDELSRRGVSPSDIARVIITHAHGDHIQGNTLRADGGFVPAFPHAEYIMQRRDAENLRSEEPQSWKAYFSPVERSGKLKLIDGDTRLSTEIMCVLSEGHTAGHQSVVITSCGESACYLGDLALHILNLQRPEWGADWAWSRDHDRDNRIKMKEWARDEDGLLILPHDASHPFVKVDRSLTVQTVSFE